MLNLRDFLVSLSANQLFWWIAIILSSLLFTCCDALSKIWIEAGKWSRVSLLLLWAISPLAYIVFAIVTKRVGLALASILVNSFLIIGTVLIGMILMGEWKKISTMQYVGAALALIGIFLILYNHND